MLAGVVILATHGDGNGLARMAMNGLLLFMTVIACIRGASHVAHDRPHRADRDGEGQN